MTRPTAESPALRRGVIRLLNTADGRVLCLAGEVDDTAVDAFRQRYGREPVRVDVVDVRSLTRLSPTGREFLREHMETAARAVDLRA